MADASSWCCPVVIDVGTSYTKAGERLQVMLSGNMACHDRQPQTGQELCAGFGGNLDPVVNIPTAVNRPGTSHASRRAEGDLTYPLKHGIVVNWSEYEQLMDECFHECVTLFIRIECRCSPRVWQARVSSVLATQFPAHSHCRRHESVHRPGLRLFDGTSCIIQPQLFSECFYSWCEH